MVSVLRGPLPNFPHDVRGSARIRAINRLLQQAWSSDPALFLQFVEDHPGLSSSDVVAVVAEEANAGPPPGESAAPLTARLRLVQSLRAGTSPRDAVDAAADLSLSPADPSLEALVERCFHAAADPESLGELGRLWQQQVQHLLLDLAYDPGVFVIRSVDKRRAAPPPRLASSMLDRRG